MTKRKSQDAARRWHGTVAAASVGLMCSVTAGWAQNLADPKACAPHEQMQQQTDQAPGKGSASVTTGSGENLSDKLARTDGVLCPPNVDPDIKAPTPPVGKMPVIPPPGSPGGNPSVQPK